MKRALVALLFSALPILAQERTPLTRGLADSLYCQLSGTCSVRNLTVTGTCTGCGISGVAWGAITGTLSSQTDLQNALNLKAPLLSPSFTTPSLGVATATSINGNVFTPGTGTLTLGAGKTTTFDHTSTFTTTDAQVYTFPTTTATLARTDTGQTLAGTNTFSGQLRLAAGTATTPTQVFTGDTGIGPYNIAASHIYAIHTGTDADLWMWMTPAGTVKLEAANDAAGADVPLVIAGSVITITPANSVAINGPTAMNNRVTFDATAESLAAYTTTGADISVLARSITDTSSSGTVAVNAVNAVAAPTLLASSATTYTDSSELQLTGPPVASTNVTQTRAHTLMVVDPTSAASSVTGGFVVATTPGTAATSVGIGGGNVNAGGNGVFGGTLGTTGAYTPSQTAGIVGTTTNNNANAGAFGEYQTGTVAANTTSLSTGTTANVGANTNITLTAGDWDCTGVVNFTFGATTSITNLTGGISTTTATLPAQDSYFDFETSAIVPTGTAVATWIVPTVRLSNSGSTNVFLVSQATFTASTLKVGGTIRCRRMR